jgi:hypothetical protein
MRETFTSGSVGRAPGNRCLYPEGDGCQRLLLPHGAPHAPCCVAWSLGTSLVVTAGMLASMPRRLPCLPHGGCRRLGRRGALQQATLLQESRETQEQRIIGTEQCAYQPETEDRQLWRITMGTAWLHGRSPPSKRWEPREKYRLASPACLGADA